MMYEAVLTYFSGVQRRGNDKAETLCPAHNDTEQSLSVNRGQGGKTLITCHANCRTEDVVKAAGLTMAELFENGQPPHRQASEMTWEIKDEDGIVIALHHRQNLPGGKKKMWWSRPDNPGGLGGLKVNDLPLYGSELLASRPGEPVFVVEGEPACDALDKIGVLAVATVTGAKGTPGRRSLEVLQGREVYPWPDRDEPGRKHIERTANGLAALGVIGKIITWPDAPPKGDAADFVAAGGNREDLDVLQGAAQLWTPPSSNGSRPERPKSGLPEVELVDRPLRDTSTEALENLRKANNPPKIFVRGAALARTRTDERDRPIIDTHNAAGLSGLLTRVMDFIGPEGKVYPPKRLVEDILALGEWPFPPLEGITEVPVLRPNGSILDTPGYDTATRLIYRPAPGLRIPSIPEHPSPEDVGVAVTQIEEVLYDFPFVDAASRANAYGAILTPLIRPAINSQVPIALIRSPIQGSGKSLLTEIITYLATGRPAAMFGQPKDDEEMRKSITSALIDGSTVILIDNVTKTLGSGALARALTAPVWADRILGRSEIVRLSQSASWYATGNNVAVAGDMIRRSYWIQLDPREPRPWLRTGFKHDDLMGYVIEHRGELLAALLTLARAWYAAGCPHPSNRVTMGSFQRCVDAISGILEFAGVDGFLTNLPALYEAMDEDTASWEGFLEVWHSVLGSEAVPVKHVCDSLQESTSFRDALPETLAVAWEKTDETKGMKSFSIKLGKALKQKADTLYGNGLRLQRGSDDSHNKVALWEVVFAGSGP